MRGPIRSFSLGALALGLVPATADAGGLFLPGVGPIAQSRAGAYVATAEDPSAIAVNSAGLAKTDGIVVFVGANLIDYSMTFTRRGAYEQIEDADLAWEGQAYEPISDTSSPPIGVGPFQAVPLIAVAIDLEDTIPGLHVGAGVIAPSAYPVRKFGDYDLATDEDMEAPPPTRYDVVEQEAAVVQPSVAVGYRVNENLDIGARFTWGIAHVSAKTYVWGRQNFEEWTGSDSEFTVDATDNFVPGAGIGVLWRPTHNVELGLNWDSNLEVHAKGTGHSVASQHLELTPGEPVVIEPPPDAMAQCAPGGEVDALKACVDLALPQVTTIGGRYILKDEAGNTNGDVEVNVAWERWSAASDYHVLVDGVVLGSLPLNASKIRHNLQDVISVRLGGSYRLPVGDGLILRAGVAHDTAAAKEGFERVDFDGAARTTAAMGLAYGFGAVTVQVGAGFVYEGTREVGTDCNPEPGNLGCEGGDNSEEPLDERTGPDPIQPLNPGTPFQSPFNAGTYESSYLLAHLALIARF